MGNCLDADEDVGMSSLKNTAVGQGNEGITDELLSASLSGGGLK